MGFSIGSIGEFFESIDTLTASEKSLKQAGGAAGQYIQANLGATDLIYNDLFRHTSEPTDAETENGRRNASITQMQQS